jgi:gamma-glutamyltranspeptidase/glutathione hydrolase
MLGVAESQSSGIGGLTNILIHLANGRTIAIDGTSHVPITIDIERFRRFKDTGRTFGYETIAVPTTLATLEYARRRYGTLSLATLLQPAIEVAENGYPLSESEILKTRKYYDDLMNSSAYMRSLVLEDGRKIGKPGDRRFQSDLAKTYRRIAAEGVRSFYVGGIADQIEADMIQGGAFLRKTDLARVTAREVQPLRTPYRGFDVLTFPPPGGGAGVASILDMLEAFPSGFLATDSVERLHVFIEVFRIAAADARASALQWKGSRSDRRRKQHARAQAALIKPGRAIPNETLAMSRWPTAPATSYRCRRP